jgi:hypothetical protein
MKVRDVIFLVKYAQGGIIFNSFLEYIQHMKPAIRNDFFAETVELIKKLEPTELDAVAAIEKSGQNADSKQSLILKLGVNSEQLGKILSLQDEDMEGTLKVLLLLFSAVYKRAYTENGNDINKFWYWDYSLASTAYKVIEMDTKQDFDISSF